jgi:hypothetical protein
MRIARDIVREEGMDEQASLPTKNDNAVLPEPTKCDDGARGTTAEQPKEENAPHKGNPDSEGLGWYGNDRIVIGCVDEVNGAGSIEFPSFVPTRHELIQLAKYWATVRIDLDFSYFVDGQTGSTEIRLGPFASRRVARIAEALGEEEVAKAVNEAYDEFGKGIDPRKWRIFREGTPEEQQALQEEFARAVSGIEDPQLVARITGFMESLGLDLPVAEEGKAVRFAILLSRAAAVADPACLIVPILHYVNADADGHYRKDDTGSVPPIHWEVRSIGVSRLEMKHIQRLPDPGQAADDIDIIILRSDPSFGRKFSRASHSARWKKNPDLVAEVEKAATDAAAALVAKVAGREGVTLLENFKSASTAIE